MKAHAFVAMPFGTKKDANGNNVNFDDIYDQFLKPSIEAAGLEVFRADNEKRAGNIIDDMFQELLIADLVLVDTSIENANVWYELGVRHALRSRGVILTYAAGSKKPFDIHIERKFRYGLKEGKLDPETLENDIEQLSSIIKETMKSWRGRKISPVYNSLPNLQEPDWKSLRMGDINEFWEKYDKWKDKIELARKNHHIGDILVLADEAPIAAFRAEAWIQVGQDLRKSGHFKFALELLDRGLEVEPENLMGLHEKGMCLQRLALKSTSRFTLAEAEQHYNNILQIEKYKNDPETLSLLGRVEKDIWIESWDVDGYTSDIMIEEATDEIAYLENAIEVYKKAYQLDTTHYYSGINALTLMELYQHLTGDEKYKEEIEVMSGAVRYSAKDKNDYWALATIGDLEILVGTPESVKKAYKQAIARSKNDWFALDSCLSQLLFLNKLKFKPDNVLIGIETFKKTIEKEEIKKPKETWRPRKVFLFSGHMVDTHDRSIPRFPADKVPIAKEKILEKLKYLDACEEDLALTQGACGGDILFTEACQSLGVKVRWMQPFDEPKFIQKSINHCNEDWKERYNICRESLDNRIRHAPSELGELPEKYIDGYPYERCNKWLLYTALSYGFDKVHFITLWDGKGGDGSGGTAHMYKEVEDKTGNVHQIETEKL